MKRIIALVCILSLALCLAPAGAAAMDYVLPDGLQAIDASAAGVTLPDGLPEPVQIVSFSVTDGLIRLELDREVPSVKILELNFLKAEESTIFSKKETAAAETHRTGDENSVFTVRLTWSLDGLSYIREYNTWSGELQFSRAYLTETPDAAGFTSWDAVSRDLAFRENGSLLTETWKLEKRSESFTRAAHYGEDGRLESYDLNWLSADYGGDLLNATLTPGGAVLALQCRTKKTDFTVDSLPLDADAQAILNLRDNSYNPGVFEGCLRAAYPRLTETLYSAQAVPGQPSTATDLPSTATDLPVSEDVPAEEIPEGEPTENTRLWLVAFGDYFESTVYGFASDDPLFILEDGKAVPNPAAKDINGTPVEYNEMNKAQTPAFEVPAVR